MGPVRSTTETAGPRNRGQAISETLVLLPIYLALILFVIQISQIGLAIILTNYGASKVVHQAVSENTTDPARYKSLLDSVMIAGMKTYSLTGHVDDPNSHTRMLTVEVAAEIRAFPMVGELLHSMIGSSPGSVVRLSDQAPYMWIVKGVAQSRMNFAP